MKFRISQWLDTSNFDVEELPVVYGIQANKDDGKGWRNVAADGVPMFFDTLEAAGEKMEDLKAKHDA